MYNYPVSEFEFYHVCCCVHMLHALFPVHLSLVRLNAFHCPLYSWIGVEVGYLQSTLKSAQCVRCGSEPGLLNDPFVLVVQSIRKCA